ncbi:MAG: hypothetical protein UHN47_18170 [Lachnospiraceae bacterium]|nr:hypothetical protein [Lachnospiraceae bacterium]
MKVKRVLSLVLILSMMFSMPVLAAEDVRAEVEYKQADEILMTDLTNEKEVVSENSFKSSENIKDRFKNTVERNVFSRSIGDAYESNNSEKTATVGMSGKKVSATIHANGDVDWYKLEVVDTSIPYAFVLMNIPTGCDYDMALFSEDLKSAYYQFQEGNTLEEFYIYLNEPGTYYVAVQPYSGYSSYPYTLYFGSAYKYGDTGWRDSNLEFDFGYIPQGNKYYTTVAPQYYNLTNDISIPDGAVMTDLYMNNHGNGGDWGGFYKYIKEPSGYGMELLGNIECFNVPDMAYYVKQNWAIWGKVLYSYNFTWEPSIYIGYKYVVTPQTMRFVK